MRVQLKAVGNPDFGQPENIGTPTLWVNVPDWETASKVCRGYIQEHGLGGGNWCGGTIKADNSNRVVGWVSYNGRVWKASKLPVRRLSACLYDPLS